MRARAPALPVKLEVEIWTARIRSRMIFVVFNCLTGDRPARHAILFAHPLTKINELAAFGTKWSKGIIFPLELFVTGWTLMHGPNAAQI
jgi:hypothetical protein